MRTYSKDKKRGKEKEKEKEEEGAKVPEKEAPKEEKAEDGEKDKKDATQVINLDDSRSSSVVATEARSFCVCVRVCMHVTAAQSNSCLLRVASFRNRVQQGHTFL